MCYEFWDEKFNIGVKDIDEQHKELLKIINHLRSAIKTGIKKEMLMLTIEKLQCNTLLSFRLEEEYMIRYNFHNLETHISEHNNFISRIEEFKNNFSCGDTMSTLHGLDYFILWLTFHITEFDKEYSLYKSSAA